MGFVFYHTGEGGDQDMHATPVLPMLSLSLLDVLDGGMRVISQVGLLTVSSEAAALMSGRNPTSSTCSKKSWFSMPYTRSRKSTMDALWSGTKDADIFG